MFVDVAIRNGTLDRNYGTPNFRHGIKSINIFFKFKQFRNYDCEIWLCLLSGQSRLHQLGADQIIRKDGVGATVSSLLFKKKLEQVDFPTENQMSPHVQLVSAHIIIMIKYEMSVTYVILPMAM